MSKKDDEIGFLGLGTLGMPIAENLLAAGKALAVWNRTASKAEALVAKGARHAGTSSDAVPRGGVVFTILWDDASLEEIVSPAFLEALGDGIHVSMTTVTPETSRKIAALHAKHGSTLVESPLFGIPTSAVARQITACTAGPTAAKERVRPLLEAMGASKIYDEQPALRGISAERQTAPAFRHPRERHRPLPALRRVRERRVAARERGERSARPCASSHTAHPPDRLLAVRGGRAA